VIHCYKNRKYYKTYVVSVTFSFQDTRHRQMAQTQKMKTWAPQTQQLIQAASFSFKADGSAPHGILCNTP
jgi:hypothetical protein